MSTSLTILVVSVLAAVWLVDAAVFHDDYTIKTVMVNGKPTRWTDKYCEYRFKANPKDKQEIVFKIRPWSRFIDQSKCMKCICGGPKPGGLSCATMLHRINYPKETSKCMPITVRCRTKWVLVSNPNRRCPKLLMPPMSAVGK